MTHIIQSFAEIADGYDMAIIDLWGVVHDGTKPYPDVLACLDRMGQAGIERVLLSNAPRRATAVTRQIERIGVPPAYYDDVISSGEIAHRMLAEGRAKVGGSRYYYVGAEKDANLLEGLSYHTVSDIAGADFLLVTGLRHDETEAVADYEAELAAARRRDLPFVCANPDLRVMRGARILQCAGVLAERYAALGGRVIQFGKPYRAAYEACMVGRNYPLSRVIAIGDTPRTDLAGAAAFGIDAVFVSGGLHNEDVGDPIDEVRLRRFLAGAGTAPEAVIPALRW